MGHAGPMTYAQTSRSLELYATHVAPALQELTTTNNPTT
jgi:hypothetical protein